MIQMKSYNKSLLILALLFIVSFQISVMGERENLEKLPDLGVNFECRTCHVTKSGGGELNPFGSDFRANNLTYNGTLGAKDSDSDGFTNKEEFAAEPVTNPGDADSFPDRPLNVFVILLIAGVIIAIIMGTVFIMRS